MISEHKVATLKPGNSFRDWLIEVLGDRIQIRDARSLSIRSRGHLTPYAGTISRAKGIALLPSSTRSRPGG